MSKSSVTLRVSDYAQALSLAETFNVKAGARPNRKVKAVLKEAVAFLQSVTGEVKKGNVVETGSAWHGPDEFLSVAKARELAREKDRTDYLTRNIDVALPKRDAAGIASIRKAFKLSSDKQAAGLAVRVYASVTDGLWRGNGFSYANANAPVLDTDPIKEKLVANRKP